LVIPWTALAAGPAICDFDGDDKSDPTIVRNEGGVGRWWILRSSDLGVMTFPFGNWSTDTAFCGDVNGDTLDDIVVYRPGVGFYSLLTGSGTVQVTPMGLVGDVPLLADANGDDADDFIVYRPGTPGVFWVLAGGGFAVLPWGTTGDRPYLSDRDGDGLADLSVMRPAPAAHWILRSSDSGLAIASWGLGTDAISPLDYTGDAQDDIGVVRDQGSNYVWYVQSATGSAAFFGATFGLDTDQLVPGDYDGDGLADLAVWRESSGMWWIRDSFTNGLRLHHWGSSGDYPVLNFAVR
jgi:hypothetical protein